MKDEIILLNEIELQSQINNNPDIISELIEIGVDYKKGK